MFFIVRTISKCNVISVFLYLNKSLILENSFALYVFFNRVKKLPDFILMYKLIDDDNLVFFFFSYIITCSLAVLVLLLVLGSIYNKLSNNWKLLLSF